MFSCLNAKKQFIPEKIYFLNIGHLPNVLYLCLYINKTLQLLELTMSLPIYRVDLREGGLGGGQVDTPPPLCPKLIKGLDSFLSVESVLKSHPCAVRILHCLLRNLKLISQTENDLKSCRGQFYCFNVFAISDIIHPLLCYTNAVFTISCQPPPLWKKCPSLVYLFQYPVFRGEGRL